MIKNLNLQNGSEQLDSISNMQKFNFKPNLNSGVSKVQQLADFFNYNINTI